METIKGKSVIEDLKPRDLLPLERELSGNYQISRPTIRQALKDLVNEGLLYREKRKGTLKKQIRYEYKFLKDEIVLG